MANRLYGEAEDRELVADLAAAERLHADYIMDREEPTRGRVEAGGIKRIL